MAHPASSSPSLLLPLLLATFFLHLGSGPPTAAAATYNVVALGARPDGRADSSRAFLSAWAAACASSSPSQIYVPPGRFLIASPLVFAGGRCRSSPTTIRIDGTLVAPSDYRALRGAANWIMFQHVSGVSILGGTLDGQGAGLWACKASGGSCPFGATSLEFMNSDNIFINGLTSVNSQLFHIVIDGCRNVKLQQVKVAAAGSSPNTDGIHVQTSTGVTILGSTIQTGDDCVSIGPGTTGLWIEKVGCGPGHGISIGSLGKDAKEAGVENVTVKAATFSGTQNGVRIKSWGRPSTGFVRHVLFQQVRMMNVENPIIIDQSYCPDDHNCPGVVSGVKISDVTYEDIEGTSATAVGVKLDCSPGNPCTGIRMENVKLTYDNRPAQSSCVHAAGTASAAADSSDCL